MSFASQVRARQGLKIAGIAEAYERTLSGPGNSAQFAEAPDTLEYGFPGSEVLVLFPSAAGANVTLIVQLPPPAMPVPHDWLATAKSPLAPIELILNGV